jgi:hypothetical protein
MLLGVGLVQNGRKASGEMLFLIPGSNNHGDERLVLHGLFSDSSDAQKKPGHLTGVQEREKRKKRNKIHDVTDSLSDAGAFSYFHRKTREKKGNTVRNTHHPVSYVAYSPSQGQSPCHA